MKQTAQDDVTGIRFYYDQLNCNQFIKKTSPPTFPAAGTIVLRLPRSLYASTLILVCYDPTTLVLIMSKISVLGA